MAPVTPAPLTQWERDRWRQDAACRPDRRPEGMDRAAWTALFFPERGNRISPALNICAQCPVRAECRAEANGSPLEREGIWGGMSGRQRRRTRDPHPPAKRYPPSVRAEALRLSESGMTDPEVAARLDLHPQTIRGWRRKAAA